MSSGPSPFEVAGDGWSTMSNQQAPSQTAAETAAMRHAAHAARLQLCVNPAARCRKWLMAKHKLDRKIGEPCAVKVSFAGVCTQHRDTQRHPYAHTHIFSYTFFDLSSMPISTLPQQADVCSGPWFVLLAACALSWAAGHYYSHLTNAG